MYAAVNTRPDVAFATGQLARVVQCPNEEQVAAGMRVAKYLGQTATVGLQFSAAAQRRQKGADGVEPGRLFLTAFSDASYASEPEDMTSVGEFICCVGGGPTAWESKKQVDQALSSVESEYMALFRADSLTHVCAPAVDKLSARTRSCIFLGFPLDAPGWTFYDPAHYRFFASHDVTFDESPPPPPPPPPHFLFLWVFRTFPRNLSPAPLSLQHRVLVDSEGARLGGSRTGADDSGGARCAGAEAPSMEDKAASHQRPTPASPPGLPLQLAAAETGGVPEGGAGGAKGIAVGGSDSRGTSFGGVEAGKADCGASAQAAVRYLTREQHHRQLEREKQERFKRVEEEHLQSQQEQEEAKQQLQQQDLLQPQKEEAEQQPKQQVQLQPQQTPEEAEQQRLRELPDAALACFVRGPLNSPYVPPDVSLSLSLWSRRAPLSRVVSPESCPSCSPLSCSTSFGPPVASFIVPLCVSCSGFRLASDLTMRTT
ncbi:unnamed protein product [Closterium sp. NIES-53]